MITWSIEDHGVTCLDTWSIEDHGVKCITQHGKTAAG